MVGSAPSKIGAARQPLVENAERVVDAALEEIHHRGISGRLGEIAQEAIRPEKTVDLLIVEYDPAQHFELLIFALRQEFSGAFGEIGQDRAGLAELLYPVDEHRRFAHFVDLAPVLRRAQHAFRRNRRRPARQSAPIRLSISAAR